MNNKPLTGEDLGNLLLQSVKEMKDGKVKRTTVVKLARTKHSEALINPKQNRP